MIRRKRDRPSSNEGIGYGATSYQMASFETYLASGQSTNDKLYEIGSSHGKASLDHMEGGEDYTMGQYHDVSVTTIHDNSPMAPRKDFGQSTDSLQLLNGHSDRSTYLNAREYSYHTNIGSRPMMDRVPSSSDNNVIMDGLDNDITDSFKRVRITKTPGELRLQRDVQDVIAMNVQGCSIRQINGSGVLIAISLHSDISANCISSAHSIGLSKTGIDPAKGIQEYKLTISTYYPHSKPKIKCLNTHRMVENIWKYTDREGYLQHPVLDNWSAIMTLKDVIALLLEIGKDGDVIDGKIDDSHARPRQEYMDYEI